MKKLFLLASCYLLLATVTAQNVGIGTTTPNASAQLDVQSTSKGFLPPRMSSSQRSAIASPTAGLIVYDTDINQLFLYDGSGWQPLIGGTSSNSIYPSQQPAPAADQQVSGCFGVDVALAGNYAVIGAQRADSGTKTNTGAVYVYKKGTSGAWTKVAKLFAADAQSNSYFGGSVAISGNYIVAGAPQYSEGATYYAGKVYVFVKGVGDTWTQQTAFTQPGGLAGSNYFGYNVALSTTSVFGPAIIVGAPYANVAGFNSGAAYTYRYGGGSWSFQQALTPGDLSANDNFGWEVDIDGDYCVAGSPGQMNVIYSAANAGAAYIYVFGGGVWSFQQKLNDGTVANGELGFSISLHGDMLALGAPYAGAYSNTTGQVNIYHRNVATWGTVQNIYLLNSDGFTVGNRLGVSVSLDSNKLLIGLPGGYMFHGGSTSFGDTHSYVAVYKQSANNYFYLSKMLNDDALLPYTTSLFGNSVSMNKGNYVIGIPDKDVNGLNDIGTISFGYVQ